MSLTVRQLTEIASLQTSFLAGRGGGERPVTWAHSTELPDPWNWLGAGDLLLSNGYSVPEDEAAQADFVRGLDGARLSGIVFSSRTTGPVLLPGALAVADELDFPVLETVYSVPWIMLSRIVADSNNQRASARLVKVLRQYDVLRRTYQSGGTSDDLLVELGTECECALFVADARSGAVLLPVNASWPSEGLRNAVVGKLSGDAPPPAFTRFLVDGESTLALPLNARDQTVMLATSVRPTADLDLVVLQHAATIVGLEVERRLAASARRRETGSRLLHQLLSGSIDTEVALGGLAAFKLQDRPWQLLCWGEESGTSLDEMQRILRRAGIPSLVGHSGSESLALVRAGAVDATAARRLTGSAPVHWGLSSPVHGVGRVPDASREARWALETAREAGLPLAVYGDQGPLFLPRSVAEGEAAVARLLGPVIDYDKANDGQLLRSLIAYFDHNRSWQDGADALGVHRQTLIYRVRRIEEITGRKLQDLAHLTDFYLAVRTWKMLELDRDASGDSPGRSPTILTEDA